MFPYFILLLVILIISLLREKIGNKNYLKLIFLLLFIFLVLKDYKTFPDHEYYLQLFNSVNERGLIETLQKYHYEPAYIIYNFLISLFTNDYNIYLIATGAISLIGPYLFIKKNSNNYFLSIMIYIALNFYSMNFYVLRASIAFSIFLIGFNFIKEKKYIKSILMIILAGLFHKSLFIFLPFCYLLNINYSKTSLKILSIILSIMFILRDNIVNLFVKIIYRDYLNYIIKNDGFKLLFILIIIVSFFIYNKEKIIKKDKSQLIYINMIFYSITFQMLATVIGPINRLTTYFLVSLLILVPNYIDILENKKYKKILKILTIITSIIIFCIKVIDGTKFCNYKLFFI